MKTTSEPPDKKYLERDKELDSDAKKGIKLSFSLLPMVAVERNTYTKCKLYNNYPFLAELRHILAIKFERTRYNTEILIVPFTRKRFQFGNLKLNCQTI